MGGFFGIASKEDCMVDVFYGVDYHSHLGTRRAGMAAFDSEIGLQRKIHSIQNAPFRTKFEHIFDEKHSIWIKTIEDKIYVEKRNRILEERWQNLKEWLSIKWFAESDDLSLGDVVRKIKEFEINE